MFTVHPLPPSAEKELLQEEMYPRVMGLHLALQQQFRSRCTW